MKYFVCMGLGLCGIFAAFRGHWEITASAFATTTLILLISKDQS